MDQAKPPAAPDHIGFFLAENYSMMSLVSAIEPLRSANRQLQREAYRWSLYSLDGGPLAASNGLAMETQPLPAAAAFEHFFVCAGMDTGHDDRHRLNAALHRLARQGVRVGAISSGTFFLARAGLIGDARCTVHWEYLPVFRESFPQIAAEDSLYVFDRGLYTCSGGVASADMMLAIIARRHGAELAGSVANQFNIERIRSPNAPARRHPGARHHVSADAAIGRRHHLREHRGAAVDRRSLRARRHQSPPA
jgi:transcriptional regulator GlxA family with amidase domain